jgi:hypothetical protein
MKSAKTSKRRRRGSATFTDFFFSPFFEYCGSQVKEKQQNIHGVHEGRERERETLLLPLREREAVLLREREREKT